MSKRLLMVHFTPPGVIGGVEQSPGKMIAWCHDLSWTNPPYIPLMHEGFPWSLLR